MLLTEYPDDICFIDTETKALPRTAGTVDESVTDCGAYRYARGARVIMIQHAIGGAVPLVSAVPDFNPERQFIWGKSTIPPDLWEFYQRARDGKAWFAAWNMGFDRLMLNTIPGCIITPEMTIDVMAQAAASNMPGKLEGASRFIGRHGKQQDGKALIKMFCGADWSTDTPQTRPDEWARFKSYGSQDIDELRAVYIGSRPLPRREWEQYWASERINDRGMRVDLDLVERAAAMARLNENKINDDIRRATNGTIATVGQVGKLGQWIYDRLRYDEARELLVKAYADEDVVAGEDEALVPAKLSLASDRLEALLAFFDKLEEDQDGLDDADFALCELIEARYWGANAAPKKYGKIADMVDSDDRLKGQFVFNGARQTGRFSSRTVQVHNLVRASLTDKEHPGREAAAIETILDLELT